MITMTRAELIDALAARHPHLPIRLIEQAVKEIFEFMASALEEGSRIEIRGFGRFALRYRSPRSARNPKTGGFVETEGKYAPHFKPGKELRERVNEAIH
jgi:integration host factor subunit beta